MNIVSIDEAITLLQNGAVGVLPTDTVYGLVTSALNQKSVERFYSLKQREQKPGTLIASNSHQLLDIGADEKEVETASTWWPNPLSAVLTVRGNDYLHQGVGTLAMRVVAAPQTYTLLEQTGPLITSSANQPGETPAATVKEAIAYFGDSVDFYVDSGEIKDVLPSTIIRITPAGAEVLRQGSVTVN